MWSPAGLLISFLHLLHWALGADTAMKSQELLSEVFHNSEKDPSDYQIWSAVHKSVDEWKEVQKRKYHRKSHVQKRSAFVICYNEFGCFWAKGAFNYLKILPEAPEAIGTKFVLYTNKNRIQGKLLYYNNSSSLRNSHFNSSNPVKVIIHGFGSNGRRLWVLQMAQALLALEDANVIVVDWEKGSALPKYIQAASNAQLVGKQLAALIRMINRESGLANRDYHLIGFSLGAHVAGFTGVECPNIGRITGLDPASAFFEGYPADMKLDSSDATFVDIIHTNGDGIHWGGMGTFEPSGHVDFYPNGGREQTGCDSVFLGALSDIISGEWQSLCSHRRALRFFIESIVHSSEFRAFPCDSFENFLLGNCFPCPSQGCIHMGYHTPPHARGLHFLLTRETEPFYANHYRISITSTRGQGTTWGTLEVSFIGEDDTGNETFVLTSGGEIGDDQDIQGVIVADPTIWNVSTVVLMYSKHKSWDNWRRSPWNWRSAGQDQWDIDKVQIQRSDGQVKSFCGNATSMLSEEPKFLTLVSGDCNTERSMIHTHRVVLDVVGEPYVNRDPHVSRHLWRIQDDDTARYTWDK